MLDHLLSDHPILLACQLGDGLAGGSSYPDGSAGTVGRVQRFKNAIA